MKNLLWLLALLIQPVMGQDTKMVLVEGGSFIPLYGAGENQKSEIKDFYMDITPVTNSQFLDFVKKGKWQRSKVSRLFAGSNYLNNWDGDTSVPTHLLKTPVTNVSWFAAKAYCECQGKRLPTTNEWEYAAMADKFKKDARRDSLYNLKIAADYSTPKTYLKPVGQSSPNYWGIHDLNELVWEWTSDFNAVMISGENRDNNDKNLFCGAGSLGASDLMDYTAFVRYAFRNSIDANYTISSLGFRCVKDQKSLK